MVTSLLAAYKISFGINDSPKLPIIAYTIGFSVLLVTELLLRIMGYEVLEVPVVVIISTLLPISLATDRV